MVVSDKFQFHVVLALTDTLQIVTLRFIKELHISHLFHMFQRLDHLLFKNRCLQSQIFLYFMVKLNCKIRV